MQLQSEYLVRGEISVDVRAVLVRWDAGNRRRHFAHLHVADAAK